MTISPGPESVKSTDLPIKAALVALALSITTNFGSRLYFAKSPICSAIRGTAVAKLAEPSAIETLVFCWADAAPIVARTAAPAMQAPNLDSTLMKSSRGFLFVLRGWMTAGSSLQARIIWPG